MASSRAIMRLCRRPVSELLRRQPASSRLPARTTPVCFRGYATTVSAADLEFGQPVHETHPHMLKPGEITPGITAQEYDLRRAKLAHSLPENGVAVLPSASIQYRSGAVFFPFRQESNFLYLTGFLEPESIAVIRKTGPQFGSYDFHLLCRPKDPKAEQWSGPWSGLAAARDVFNADTSAPIHQAPELIPTLLAGASRIYTDIPSPSSPSSNLTSTLLTTTLTALSPKIQTAPLSPLVNTLRAIKSPAEISNMRHAGRISGRALTTAMKHPWTLESDLHAHLDNAFRHHGLSGPAYVPVVAGGPRGRLIHYTHNTAPLNPHDTVLVDAGGECAWYATDITRTWPLSGKFTPPQRDLYSAVLNVQRTCVSLCRADAGLSLDDIHRAADTGLREQLVNIGFDKSVLSRGGMEILFPHHVGHYVGLDVHDVPGYARQITLKPGHCVTVEPGVYVPDDDRFPRHFRGMAVRIEDSVCVDEDSPVVLSAEAVKEVEDIEALRG